MSMDTYRIETSGGTTFRTFASPTEVADFICEHGTAPLKMEIIFPLEPCGWCRRCRKDDPAGCLAVEGWLRQEGLLAA